MGRWHHTASAPSAGTLADLRDLAPQITAHEAVALAPVVSFEEESPTLNALLDILDGTDKALLYTSGTGVLSIPTRNGERRQESYSEDDPYERRHWLRLRVETENLVRSVCRRGIPAIVVRPLQNMGARREQADSGDFRVRRENRKRLLQRGPTNCAPFKQSAERIRERRLS